MNDPKIIVGLTWKNEQDTLIVMRSDGKGVLHYVAWELASMEKEGYLGQCEKVGNAVLRMLNDAHGEIVQKYPLLKPPSSPVADVRVMVLTLINLSRSHGTKAYVSTIDDLIKRHDEEFRLTSIPDSWIELRTEIAAYPD